jgi:hypothetical protein
MLTKMFVGCLAFGTVLALSGAIQHPVTRTIGILGPIVATIAYPIWGWRQGLHRRASLRERFADNCYYLGFIFTQLALVISFLPVVLLSQNITSRDVLRGFSVALGASLIGLVARTFFIQTGNTVSESADIVEGEVDALARLVSQRARTVLEEFDSLSAQLGQSYTKLGEDLGASVGDVAKTIRRFEKAVLVDVEVLEKQGTSLGEKTQAAADELAGQQKGFAAKVTSAAKAIDGLKDGLLEQAAKAGNAITTTADSIQTGLTALNGVAELAHTVKGLDGRLAAITDQLTHAGETISAATKTVEDRSASALNGAEAVIRRQEDEVLEQAQALGTDLKAAVASLEKTLTAFRAELERVRG